MAHSVTFLRTPRQGVLITLAAALLLLATAVLAAQQLPAVDADGLHLVKGSKVTVAYVRPGVDFGTFDKVMLLDCFVEFKEKWAKEYNLNSVGLQGRVSDRDVERIKQNLAAEFRKVFTEQLTKDGFPVVDAPGPGVLLLRPAIVNLDVAAPATMKSNRGNTWIRSAGEMTLYMELYDGATDELIARVIDPRADPDTMSKVANTVTNKAAVDRIIRRWASLLSDHLREVKNR